MTSFMNFRLNDVEFLTLSKMKDYNELIHTSAALESAALAKQEPSKKTFRDYFSLAVTTFGVGYLPLAPGTWGSLVGVGIYILFSVFETNLAFGLIKDGANDFPVNAGFRAFNAVTFLAFCLLGVWASNRATILFQKKDPQEAVVDEVMGQLLTFLFIPFTFSWQLILAGFVLFRLFVIWKPYPIDSLQNLPAGIGVCADDLLAGVYAGTCLSVIYAIYLSL